MPPFFHTNKLIIMQLQKAERKQAVIKLALQGPSGSGKTFSSLLLAYGLVGSWNQIVLLTRRTTHRTSIHILAIIMF